MADRATAPIVDELRRRGAWQVKVPEAADAGAPDRLACYRGVFLAIEQKAPRDRPTRIQRYQHEQIRRAGGYVVVARSRADLVAELDAIDRDLADLHGDYPGPFLTGRPDRPKGTA